MTKIPLPSLYSAYERYICRSSRPFLLFRGTFANCLLPSSLSILAFSDQFTKSGVSSLFLQWSKRKTLKRSIREEEKKTDFEDLASSKFDPALWLSIFKSFSIFVFVSFLNFFFLYLLFGFRFKLYNAI